MKKASRNVWLRKLTTHKSLRRYIYIFRLNINKSSVILLKYFENCLKIKSPVFKMSLPLRSRIAELRERV